ncbi:alpha/beta hydrolase [Phenylobacterium sp.]|uniref:alpha/beta fold hydrolase n=1 Tax=Phenylobacterium sp. TaxID=1871053 RepID=UPI0025DA7AEB|nr:alpha/beta hydrolase [Phenylobacterium sp.]
MKALPRILALCLAAASLGACARDIPYPKLEAKYASPASHFMDLPGGLRVHYRDQGPRDAPVVVLVHGFSASLHAWEPWVQRLPDYRVITLDLPGHGLTRAPDDYVPSTDRSVQVVDDVVTKLGVQKFVLGGNSMGGGVSWNYALAHQDKLDGLVLVDAGGWPSGERPKGQPAVFKLLGNPVGRWMLRNADPGLMAKGGLEKAYEDKRLVTPDLVTRYTELARAPGHRAILTGGRGGAPQHRVTPDTFRAITVPTLVMVGEKDQVIPADNSRKLAGAIPGAKLVVYPEGGHVPMEQLPDRSAADLRAFLAGLKAPAA